jgi:hypothetical protein
MDATGRMDYGRKHSASLEHAVKFVLTGWPTLKTTEHQDKYGAGNLTLGGAAQLVGWTTPQAHDAKGRSKTQKAIHGTKHGYACLARDADLVAGWATPTTRDHKDGDCDLTVTPDRGLLGRQVLLSSPASMGSRGALNPRFSLWLQGYPEEWACSGEAAMQSIRGSRRSSSKPQKS